MARKRRLAAIAADLASPVGGSSRADSLPMPAAAVNAQAEVTPMILVLLESMPAPGSIWPRDARVQWMAILDRTLDRLYPTPAIGEFQES